MRMFRIGPDANTHELCAAIVAAYSMNHQNLVEVGFTLLHNNRFADSAFEKLCRFSLNRLGKAGVQIVSWLIKIDAIIIYFAGVDGRAFKNDYDTTIIVATESAPKGIDSQELDVDYAEYMRDEFLVDWVNGIPVRLEPME